MLQHVHCGGLFDLQSMRDFGCRSNKLIAISVFPDGKMFLRDGLHRVTAIHLERPGRELHESEYVLEPMTYRRYATPNLEKGWITPFDPRFEVRLNDFIDFKNGVGSAEDPLDYIYQYRDQYITSRTEKHNWDYLSSLWPDLELESCSL